MAVQFPGEMPTRQFLPQPRLDVSQNMYTDVGQGLRQTGADVDEYAKAQAAEVERRAKIQDMIEQRKLALQAQQAKERFEQADLDLKTDQAAEQKNQFGQQQAIKDAEEVDRKAAFERKHDREKLAAAFAKSPYVKERIAKANTEQDAGKSYNEIAGFLAENDVVDTDAGKQLLASLKTDQVYHPPASLSPYNMGKKEEEQAWKYAQATRDFQPLGSNLSKVNQVLKQYGNPKGIWTEQKDRTAIPGFGAGSFNLMRKAMTDEQFNELKSSMVGAISNYRNDLYGASLTDNEIKAFNEFIETGFTGNEQQLISGLRRMEEGVKSKLNMGGLSKEAKEMIWADPDIYTPRNFYGSTGYIEKSNNLGSGGDTSNRNTGRISYDAQGNIIKGK